jgi:hypothetical protein
MASSTPAGTAPKPPPRRVSARRPKLKEVQGGDRPQDASEQGAHTQAKADGVEIGGFPQTASEQAERTPAKVKGAEGEGHPQTAFEQGERTPVANRGLAAVSLILLLAFTLCSAFTHCHSKLFRRYPMSAIEVARQLRLSVSKLPPNIRAPDAPATPLPA